LFRGTDRVIHFRSPRLLLNLVCHYLCGLSAVNFRSRVRHRSLREREYQRAPGRTFKCKCTFYLYLYANELFSRWEKRTRDSGVTGEHRLESHPLRTRFVHRQKAAWHAMPEDNYCIVRTKCVSCD